MPAALPPSLNLTGKAAIVTGASRGIGSAVALGLGTVNGVRVGPTAAPDDPDSPEREAVKAMMTAEKRLGAMDDVIEVVAFLASEGSRWINGDHVRCNGGIYIQS